MLPEKGSDVGLASICPRTTSTPPSRTFWVSTPPPCPLVWRLLGAALTPLPPAEEIEKKLNVYHKGAKIWKMLIFCQVGLSPSCPGVGGGGCHPPGHARLHLHVLRAAVVGHRCAAPFANCGLSQGGPGHLYLLKNKVATFAKVEKEEDMIQ